MELTLGVGLECGTATVVEGDPPPDAPRKPPTLYGPGREAGEAAAVGTRGREKANCKRRWETQG